MTRRSFTAAGVLAGLRPFQRRTVDHVIRRFYGPDPTRRFLVADETGLGKSIVARGVIARAVEKLQADPAAKRIDIVYVCSNFDLARQNLARLNVTGQEAAVSPGRLAMLAATKGQIHRDDGTWLKPINLVSFTPGTSFDTSATTGTAEERLLLMEILWDDLGLADQFDVRAAYRVCRASVRTWEGMRDRHLAFRQDWGPLDPDVLAEVRAGAAMPYDDGVSLLEWLKTLIAEHRVGSQVTDALHDEANEAMRYGRDLLIRSSLAALEPDLVILDEFQRFKNLLDTKKDEGELAEQLFGHPKAKVLLLSATPFKPFTLAGETDEDHQQDLFDTLQFLARGGSHHSIDDIKAGLHGYRTAVMRGDDSSELALTLRKQLLPLMCRTERPDAVQRERLKEDVHRVDQVTADDLVEFARLVDLASAVDAPLSVDYWKSAPYFANFMDGYQIHVRTREALDVDDPEAAGCLRAVRRLSRTDIEQKRPIDLGNGKLRELAQQTTGAGWEKLLWVPPTMPYTTPTGPFRDCAGMTKKLIFSSWTATPTAVASLLTYDADRRLAEFGGSVGRTHRMRARLQYRVTDGRAASMSTLALFWPVPALARLGDPLAAARSHGEPVGPDMVRRRASGVITERLREPGREPTASEFDHWYWATALTFDDKPPVDPAVDAANISALLSSRAGADDESGSVGARAHVDALAALEPPSVGERPPDLADTVAELACFSPANSAWRALRRLIGPDDQVSDRAVWEAATRVADGLRSLFNREEAMNLLDGLYGTDLPYWRAVLHYCTEGNLQSMLDEYAHQLAAERPGPLTDEGIADIAEVMTAAPALRRATFRVFDPDLSESTLSLGASFAMRYGDRSGSTAEGARPQEVRRSFNSPFWPFLLASTSVGQEGIDFHHWCHSLVHWNIPANPIDFEQREGRIDRFRGHAVRRNVVDDLGRNILREPGRGHPWDVAFRLAEERSEQRDQLYASWLYDGPAKIERTLFEFPFSKDEIALERVKRDLAHYRLAFGQGRQEDFLALVRTDSLREVEGTSVDLKP